MKKIYFLLFFIIFNFSWGASFEVTQGIMTKHTPYKNLSQSKLNEENEFIALRYNRLRIGHMINSFERPSWVITINKVINNRVSVDWGIATGYPRDGMYKNRPFSNPCTFWKDASFITIINIKVTDWVTYSINPIVSMLSISKEF